MSASYWLAPLSKSQQATGMSCHQETPFSGGEQCAASHAQCQQRERAVFPSFTKPLVEQSCCEVETKWIQEKKSVSSDCTLVFTSNDSKALFLLSSRDCYVKGPVTIICLFWNWRSSKAKLVSVWKQLSSLKFHKSESLFLNKKKKSGAIFQGLDNVILKLSVQKTHPTIFIEILLSANTCHAVITLNKAD